MAEHPRFYVSYVHITMSDVKLFSLSLLRQQMKPHILKVLIATTLVFLGFFFLIAFQDKDFGFFLVHHNIRVLDRHIFICTCCLAGSDDN